MKTPAKIQRPVKIEDVILTVRGEKVLLDMDLARIYSVSTKRLNEQVRRNPDRFPDDFMFQLTEEEFESLRSQIATIKLGRGQHRKYLPYAFTEQGAIMAANVLSSQAAVRMSIFVVRAFVKMRKLLGGTQELARQLRELEAKLTNRLNRHEAAIVDVLQHLMRLLDPPSEPEQPRRQIGFHVKQDNAASESSKGRK
jgi:hypothetical protein